MIRLQAIGLYASDFSGGNTRLGDATIIDDGKNFEVIDGNCGKGTDRLISALKARGIKNPYLHISHPHYDHRYGIRRIINDSWFKPRALYCQNPDSIKAYNGAVKSDIDALKRLIKEIDEFEYGYLPDDLIAVFSEENMKSVYTYKFDDLNMTEVMCRAWAKGIKCFCVFGYINGYEAL